jgi:hypothetical protein
MYRNIRLYIPFWNTLHFVCSITETNTDLFSQLWNNDLSFGCSFHQAMLQFWWWPQRESSVCPSSRFTEWEPTQHNLQTKHPAVFSDAQPIYFRTASEYLICSGVWPGTEAADRCTAQLLLAGLELLPIISLFTHYRWLEFNAISYSRTTRSNTINKKAHNWT